MSKPLIWILISVGVAGVLCICGTGWHVEIPFYLLVGWAFHVFHLVRETQVDWPAVGTVAVVLPLLTVGLHAFSRWFYTSRQPGQSWPWRWSLAMTAVLLLAFIAGIAVVGITHQATWMATSKDPLIEGGIRLAAGRTQAVNNLKQMGLAVNSYHDANHRLPPGSTFDAQGRGLHGWQTFLLPYLDQNHLFEKIDLQKPWNAPGNAEVMKEYLYVFQSPLVERSQDDALSHFAGNVHVFGVRPLAFAEITDGTSNTMLMGDISQNFKPWGTPGNWRDPTLGLHTSPDGFGGPDPRVTLVGMCDGTVRMVRHDISPTVMKAIATPRGGEKIDIDELER
jgi:Protein of unknown function (DUF1559)